MKIELAKESVDVGIAVRDADAALRFYRDTLGFAPVAEVPGPTGGVFHLLACGQSLVKLATYPAEPPAARSPGEELFDATGIRYWTVSVSNLDEISAALRAGGYALLRDCYEIAPGTRVTIARDPDGNAVEFIERRG